MAPLRQDVGGLSCCESEDDVGDRLRCVVRQCVPRVQLDVTAVGHLGREPV
jgi:hypothetical protein